MNSSLKFVDNTASLDQEETDSSSESDERARNNDFDSLYSNYVQSNEVVTVLVGTSSDKTSEKTLTEAKKSSNKTESSVVVASDESASQRARVEREKRASDAAKINYGDSLNNRDESAGAHDLTSYEYSQDFDENLLETLTIIEEEANAIDAQKRDTILPSHLNKLKPAAMTILLTHKWRQEHRAQVASNSKKKSKKKSKQTRFLPTFRMEPKVNLNRDEQTRTQILNRARQTFRSLVEKHGKYDTEYTPRFLKIITEMIKNDVKSFKLERYKVLVLVSIFQKRPNLDASFFSKELIDIDNDLRLCLKEETNTFHAICLMFIVYKE